MKRSLVLAFALLWLAAAVPAWSQTATPKSRQAPTPPRESTSPAKPKASPGALAPPTGDDKNAPVTVDADQLENRQKEGLIVFTGNVVASQNGSTQYADRMEVYLDAKGDNIMRTV